MSYIAKNVPEGYKVGIKEVYVKGELYAIVTICTKSARLVWRAIHDKDGVPLVRNVEPPKGIEIIRV